jgi:hypothetical protein
MFPIQRETQEIEIEFLRFLEHAQWGGVVPVSWRRIVR